MAEVSWINLLIIAALCLGHAALVIGLINRVNAFPLQKQSLGRVRLLLDLVLFGGAALFVWRAGFSGPRLLFGGGWNQLPLLLLGYLSACGAAVLSLPFVAAARLTTRIPAAQLSNHSRRIDLGARLSTRCVGDGPDRWMTCLPGNEYLTLELSDKEYRLSRLPPACDRLSILHLSDLHFIGTPVKEFHAEVCRLAQEMPSDLVVFTGDLLDREELIAWLPETLGQLSAPLGCWFVLGNHDWYLKNTADVRARLQSLGWHDLAGRCETLEHRGALLTLCGTERPWMGTHPDLSAAPPDSFRILLSHTPDHINWARRQQIDLMLCGHNHGGQLRLPGFGAIHTPSAYGTRFASGVFQEGGTLLYVSRGVAGRHPWRWNCPPELTRLILRSPESVSHTQRG